MAALPVGPAGYLGIWTLVRGSNLAAQASNGVSSSPDVVYTCSIIIIIAKMSDRVSQIAAHLNYPKGLFAGQTAIITGSGQGIGAEAARLFANEGASVVVSDIDAGT